MATNSVLHGAARLMEERFATLDDLPGALADTIANYCYQWALLTHNSELRVHVVNSVAYTIAQGCPVAYCYNLEKALRLLPDAVAELRAVRQQSGEDAFSRACELFLDKYRYNIENLEGGSSLRRKIHRAFSRSYEIGDLYQTLRSVSSAGNERLANATIA